MHEVQLLGESYLSKACSEKVITVNSFHHQAIDRVAPSLKVIARSSTDQIVEAVEAEGEDFLVALQWHPERIYQGRPENLRLVEYFIEASAKVMSVMQKRLSYKDAIRRSHREAAYTLAAALLLFLFFWCALFLTARWAWIFSKEQRSGAAFCRSFIYRNSWRPGRSSLTRRKNCSCQKQRRSDFYGNGQSRKAMSS